jgi:hypothetical protein
LAEPDAGHVTAGRPGGEDSSAWTARLRASGPLAWLVLAAGVVGAALLVAAELSNLRHTSVVTATCHDLAGPDADKCSRTGGQQHHYALLLLAVLLLVMSWGAAVGRARAAAAAMIVVGAIVLVIAIALDLPDTRKAGVLSEDFSGAREHPGKAIPLEIAGGALAILGGLAGLRLRRRPGEEPDEDG